MALETLINSRSGTGVALYDQHNLKGRKSTALGLIVKYGYRLSN